jgi:hypothetical protein
MSRKLGAVLFISLLFGYQADKLLNYLSCLNSHSGNNRTTCDCEKQLKDAPDANQPPDSQKTISQEKAEDLFVGCPGIVPKELFSSSLKIRQLPRVNTILPGGFYACIFQPPDRA